MPHQIYIVKQINARRGYNGSRGEQKCYEKCGVSLAETLMGEVTDEYSGCYATYF